MDRPQLILEHLKEFHPGAQCELVHASAWQLLMSTILSAQCTDKRVNLVTSTLYAQYPDIYSIDKLDIDELKKLIRSTGFYNNKAKNIKAAARLIIEKFGGEVPDNMQDLLQIPGVARKTANVVLGAWFKKSEGVVVDTHVLRLSARLGLSKAGRNPVKVEKDLMKLYPQKDWERISTLLVHHGRKVCFARKPNCAGCVLNDICPSAFKV